ncbi:2-phosphosulfolactate phosphatase [Taibaiella koreensis]|uniref:2-phosphosulfolactate phosphatase n=1 Tax=Taibaiella koreensis TaxID=1268548 RepID=UPI000E59CF9A|nr:2-phosphosulfolactate phosphatase [Taibaiella koreensis]
MIEKPQLEVCLSPALLSLYDTRDTIVVIIDVFRATSTIAAALHNGARAVIPVASVAECIQMKETVDNCITAGERDGQVAPGLQYGNSPLEYPADFIKGKTLALTTTNGTRLLHMVKDADTIITGSFLNLDAVCQYLVKRGKKVLLACSAWKDRVNLEDTLFAGAVTASIREHFTVHCDSARIAESLYLQSQRSSGLLDFLRDSSHFRRLAAFGLEKDMAYCVTPNQHPVVPVYNGRELEVENIMGTL